MRDQSRSFFLDLLAAAGPSGDERAAARVWRSYTSGFAEVAADALGSSTASAGEGPPHLIVMGHIDEIGLVVTHVDDDGFAWFGPVGGWDPEVLVGQRVRVLAKDGPVAGLVGKKSRHLQEGDERTTQTKIDQMWIDIGAASGEEARKIVRTGDLAVLEQPALPLQGDAHVEPRRRQPRRGVGRGGGRSPLRRAARQLPADGRRQRLRGDQLRGRAHHVVRARP